MVVIAETRTMKRKRSLEELAIMGSRKKALGATLTEPAIKQASTMEEVPPKAVTSVSTRTECPLIQTLRQYGLLESITSCLFPKDLLALALACKATYNAMFPRPESLDNLLSRIPCCGNGIVVRQRIHHKSTFFYAYECSEFTQCLTDSGRQNIESHPCISCKVNTCDECRIHCVYQSIFETPSDPQELPNFSGFVLLDPFEVAILSPQHLPPEPVALAPWRNRATDAAAGPYHDQGFLDMPLEFDQAGTPVKVSDVLDVDLGLDSLKTWSTSSQSGFPSPVLRSLCSVTEKRKLFLCGFCFATAPKGYKAIKPELSKLPWLDAQIDNNAKVSKKALKECHCSLRSRVLDRWECVKCYEVEDTIIGNIQSFAPNPDTRFCRCGRTIKRIMCMWCWGEIIEGRDLYE